jgi:hypothetical protein
MNCNANEMWRRDFVEAYMWMFAKDYKAERYSNQERGMRDLFDDIKQYFNKSMHFSTGREEKNEYCIYLDEVPDVALAYGDNKGAMGLYELPLKLVSGETNTEVTTEDLKEYIEHHERFSGLLGKKGEIDEKVKNVMAQAQGIIQGKNPSDLTKEDIELLTTLQQQNADYQKELQSTFEEVKVLYSSMDEYKKVAMVLKPNSSDKGNSKLNSQIKSCVRGSISVTGTNSQTNCDVVALSTIIKELQVDDAEFLNVNKNEKPPLHFIIVHACTQGVAMPSAKYTFDDVDKVINLIQNGKVQAGGKKKGKIVKKLVSKSSQKPVTKPTQKTTVKPKGTVNKSMPKKTISNGKSASKPVEIKKKQAPKPK